MIIFQQSEQPVSLTCAVDTWLGLLFDFCTDCQKNLENDKIYKKIKEKGYSICLIKVVFQSYEKSICENLLSSHNRKVQKSRKYDADQDETSV